jgi:hypothetical protein
LCPFTLLLCLAMICDINNFNYSYSNIKDFLITKMWVKNTHHCLVFATPPQCTIKHSCSLVASFKKISSLYLICKYNLFTLNVH